MKDSVAMHLKFGIALSIMSMMITCIHSRRMDTCPVQAQCISFTQTENAPANICTNTGCEFTVCLTLSMQGGSCPSMISHICEKDCDTCLDEDDLGFSSATEIGNVPAGYTQCQKVGPDTKVEFLLKDGPRCGFSASVSVAGGGSGSATCEPRPASTPSCTGNRVGKECVWTYVTPSCNNTITSAEPCGDGLPDIDCDEPETQPDPEPDCCEPALVIEACFSPTARITVLGRGDVAMKDLVVADKVLTASGEYQKVFTIDHHHHSKSTAYIRIHTDLKNEQPLELTPNHMIFTHVKDYPVPASDIEVGTIIQSVHGPVQVTKIENVTRQGLYNPLTSDGTIVVDGIIASTYQAYEGKAHIEIAGLKFMSFHDMVNLACDPYRAFCENMPLAMCNQHAELSQASYMMRHLYTYWSQQKALLQLLFLFILIPAIYLIGAVLRFLFIAVMVTVIASIWCNRSKKVNKRMHLYHH